MRVQLGNATPHAHLVDHEDPCVYTWDDNGCGLTHVAEGRPNGKDALIHVLTNDITHLPDNAAFVSIVRDFQSHSPTSPTFANSEDCPDLALMLSEAYGCPVGLPDDVEDTHHTTSGPPGVGPAPVLEAVEG